LHRWLAPRSRLSAGRATGAKQGFYRRLSELLADRIGRPAGDLAVILVENDREDWSFGRGQASYLELPREAWR
jgi:4-oxalocrotonate tautomerase